MDDVDRATQRIEELSGDALAEVRRKMPRGASAEFCQAPDCGERIPPARRKAVPGVQLCIDCQSRAEWPRAIRKPV